MTDTPPIACDKDLAAIARRIDRPVVLVGMMGVGKTTVGKRLAAMMGRSFVDADQAIEAAADRTVSEIFAHHGEAYFRDGERRVIARLLEGGCGVLATGGGAFANADTRALILRHGIAVWLDCDLDTLVQRTARRDSRPLLRDGNPREILARLQAERAPAYEEAPIHIMADNSPHHVTAQRILMEVGRWL